MTGASNLGADMNLTALKTQRDALIMTFFSNYLEIKSALSKKSIPSSKLFIWRNLINDKFKRLDDCQNQISMLLLEEKDTKAYLEDFVEAEKFRDGYLEICSEFELKLAAAHPDETTDKRTTELGKTDSNATGGILSVWSDAGEKGSPELFPGIPNIDYFGLLDKISSKTVINAVPPLIVVLLSFFFTYFFANKLLFSSKTSNPLFDVDSVVSTLRRNFDFLHEKNFEVLRVALNRVDKDGEPAAPVVLLVVSLEDDETAANAFAGTLAKALDKNNIRLNSYNWGMDYAIEEYVRENRTNVFLFNVQRLDRESVLSLYAFCDDKYAPYKRVVYVVTAVCESLKSSENDWNKIGEDCLMESSWNVLIGNMRYPLVKKLTRNVMIFEK